MKLRTTPDGLIAHDPDRDRWVAVDYDRGMVAFLGEPVETRAAALTDRPADPSTAGIPFAPGNVPYTLSKPRFSA